MAISVREQFMYMAKVAGQAERYEEMVEFMEKACYATNGNELTEEEMNLLSIAYKNVTRTRRASWRILFSMEQKAGSRCKAGHVQMIREYRAKIESELSRFCNGIINLVESTLMPSAASQNSKVFYLKMMGDYFRYLAEFTIGLEKQSAVQRTLASYEAAQDNIKDLSPTHPIRLGLALNFSVFYYEILESPDRACNLAKSALDAAVAELNTLGQESCKGSSVFMQILHDNINLWTSDMQDDSADEIKEASASKPRTGK